MINDLFSRREIAVMAMSLDSYIHRSDCPETDGIKAELRECVRKLHTALEYPAADEPAPRAEYSGREAGENQYRAKAAPIYVQPLEDEHEIAADSDLFK